VALHRIHCTNAALVYNIPVQLQAMSSIGEVLDVAVVRSGVAELVAALRASDCHPGAGGRLGPAAAYAFVAANDIASRIS
jgi:hypothetical protein